MTALVCLNVSRFVSVIHQVVLVGTLTVLEPITSGLAVI